MEERPQGRHNNVKVDEESEQCVVVEENCVLTLTEINRELQRRVSRSSYSFCLCASRQYFVVLPSHFCSL